MSENENNEMVETTDEAAEAVEAAEVAVDETAAAEVGDEAGTEAELDAEPAVEPEKNLDEELINKIKKAENLLFRRRMALERAAEEKASQVNELARAIKLLELKSKMEQKEMADLLGMRLRELDALLADAEKCDLVGRIEPEEPDMRKVLVFASEDALEHVGDIAKKVEPLVPGLSNEDVEELFAQLDRVIKPLVALGLDEERAPRGGFGGRDDRGGRGGFGGGRGRDDRGGRGGFGGNRGRDDRGGRGGFGGGRGRDDRGGRGGFGGRDDRGPRGGFGGGRGRDDRGGRGGFGGRDDRGGRGGFGSNRGGFGGGRGRY